MSSAATLIESICKAEESIAEHALAGSASGPSCPLIEAIADVRVLALGPRLFHANRQRAIMATGCCNPSGPVVACRRAGRVAPVPTTEHDVDEDGRYQRGTELLDQILPGWREQGSVAASLHPSITSAFWIREERASQSAAPEVAAART